MLLVTLGRPDVLLLEGRVPQTLGLVDHPRLEHILCARPKVLDLVAVGLAGLGGLRLGARDQGQFGRELPGVGQDLVGTGRPLLGRGPPDLEGARGPLQDFDQIDLAQGVDRYL